MQVRWKDGMTKGDNAPMTVKAVEVESGSRISADLLVVEGAGGDDGLLDVIQAQMEAIDELSKTGDAKADKAHEDLQEWADQFPLLVEDLCMALGFARNPVGPTGIAELDVIVRLAR